MIKNKLTKLIPKLYFSILILLVFGLFAYGLTQDFAIVVTAEFFAIGILLPNDKQQISNKN